MLIIFKMHSHCDVPWLCPDLLMRKVNGKKKKWFLNQKSFFDLTKILSGKRLGEPYLHCCIFFPLSKESILGKLLISTIYHLYQVCAHEAPFTGGLMLVELRGIPLVENALTSKYS